MLKVSIDYLSGICYRSTLDQCEELLDDLARLLEPKDEPFIEHKSVRLGKVYSKTIKSACNMFGGIRKTRDDEYEILIQLPGQFCRRIQNQVEAIKVFNENFRATRLDIALDDYTRRIGQAGVDSLGKQGHYKNVDSYELISSKSGQDSQLVSTCYFGALDGNKMIRFYNAEAVHGFQADRWELQTRAHYAEEILITLGENADSPKLTEIMGGFVTGAIDFIKPGKNWYQGKRYEFWESLREELPNIKLNYPIQESSLEKIERWLNRQVAPTLSMLEMGIGRQNYLNLMENIATKNRNRLTEQQRTFAKYLQNGKEVTKL